MSHAREKVPGERDPHCSTLQAGRQGAATRDLPSHVLSLITAPGFALRKALPEEGVRQGAIVHHHYRCHRHSQYHRRHSSIRAPAVTARCGLRKSNSYLNTAGASAVRHERGATQAGAAALGGSTPTAPDATAATASQRHTPLLHCGWQCSEDRAQNKAEAFAVRYQKAQRQVIPTPPPPQLRKGICRRRTPASSAVITWTLRS